MSATILNPTTREHRYPNTDSQVQALALSIAQQLQAALLERGQATLAVSGGRSPIALFQTLRQAALDWAHVSITLVDERCVPEDHPDSNARLVREHLLADRAAAARFVSWLPGVPQPDALTPDALAQHANQRLGLLPPPWDVAVLGMGDDGHTASWFPNSPGLAQAMHQGQAVSWVRPGHAPHLRLTLTRAAVLACRHLHLAIAGATKLAVYSQARQGETLDLPVSVALARAASLDVWIAE